MRIRFIAFPILIALLLVLIGCSPKTQPAPDKPPEAQQTQQTQPSSQPDQQASSQPQTQQQPKPPDPAYTFPPQELSLITATVTRVVDGDTVHVSIASRDETVRFIGVDTPETVHPTRGEEPYGHQASDFTKAQLTGKAVFLETDVEQRDKYGRLLAYVWMEQPGKINDATIRAKMFNARLLLEGYAQLLTIPPNVKYVDYFTKYQKEAREAGRGLWGITDTTAPSTTAPAPVTAAPKAETSGKYVGSAKSNKYHLPTCRYAEAIAPENRMWFNSEAEAQAAGYVPCKVCRP